MKDGSESKNGFRRLFPRGGLVALAGALTWSQVAQAAPMNVVTCVPTGSVASTVKVSPGLVFGTDAPFTLSLSATTDGCTASTIRLSDWVAASYGTEKGAQIAQARITLSARGFGTCNFFQPTDASYYPVGRLKVHWLDAAGKPIKGVKTTIAPVRVTVDFATFSAQAVGTVSKGIGIGANILAQIALDQTNPANNPLFACNAGQDPNALIKTVELLSGPTDKLEILFP